MQTESRYIMKIKGIIFFIFLIIISACSEDSVDNPLIVGDDCLRGTGNLVSEDRSLPNFTAIVNTIPANVFITQGDLEDVRVEARSDIIGDIRTVINLETLTIRVEECIQDLGGVEIHVTIPEITDLTITGVGNMTAVNDLVVTQLDLSLTGVGNFNLRGSAQNLDIDIAGSGSINAFPFETDICDINISGEGDAEVFVNDELDVTITGVGDVFYQGMPVVTSTITGVGTVVDAN